MNWRKELEEKHVYAEDSGSEMGLIENKVTEDEEAEG